MYENISLTRQALVLMTILYLHQQYVLALLQLHNCLPNGGTIYCGLRNSRIPPIQELGRGDRGDRGDISPSKGKLMFGTHMAMVN